MTEDRFDRWGRTHRRKILFLGVFCIPIAFLTYAMALVHWLDQAPLWVAATVGGIHIIAWLAVAASLDFRQERRSTREGEQA